MTGRVAIFQQLSGKPDPSPAECIGKMIISAILEDNELRLKFEDGMKIRIFDNGQSCCEDRYMRTDDDVTSLVGHRLVRIEAKDGPSETRYYGEHETCFVEISTDDGFITLVNHNEHNGRYSGFFLNIKEI